MFSMYKNGVKIIAGALVVALLFLNFINLAIASPDQLNNGSNMPAMQHHDGTHAHDSAMTGMQHQHSDSTHCFCMMCQANLTSNSVSGFTFFSVNKLAYVANKVQSIASHVLPYRPPIIFL